MILDRAMVLYRIIHSKQQVHGLNHLHLMLVLWEITPQQQQLCALLAEEGLTVELGEPPEGQHVGHHGQAERVPEPHDRLDDRRLARDEGARADVRSTETNLGNLVAEVPLLYEVGADATALDGRQAALQAETLLALLSGRTAR